MASGIDSHHPGTVGSVYPAVEPVGTDGLRFRRHWPVRTSQLLPDQTMLEDLVKRFAQGARELLVDAYRGHASSAALHQSFPDASVVRIDDHHCVVVIESPDARVAIGDAAAIGTWKILRDLDAAIEIDDLVGIPKRLWFQMR